VIIGKRDHVEVRGITEDLRDFDVVLSEEDVNQLAPRPRFGIAAQTTQPIDKVQRLIELIRQRFPEAEVRFEDTVCQPTKQRQAAAVELAAQCDVVVVVGGANSNNTRELVTTCRRSCQRVFHVQSAAELTPSWFESAEVVGLTAGTSTPDVTIDSVERWLLGLSEMKEAASAGAHSSSEARLTAPRARPGKIPTGELAEQAA
jgi:4-hydroxy-3-methylbut-2-enyl diphosphate reductase